MALLRSTRFHLLLAVLTPLYAGLGAQAAPPAQMELRSPSPEAKALFREALFEAQNVGGPQRVRRAIDSAVKLDPNFTLARVYQTLSSPETGEVRAQKITELLAAMGSAPMPEILLTIYWREVAAGRATGAVPVLKTLVDLVPGDADIVWPYVNAQAAGKPVQEQVALRRDFAKSFPKFAAVHNTLAYQFASFDLDAAIASVGEYVRLAPNHPNPHDSYADILMLKRQPAEALPHVQRETELDPEFTQGPMKLGAIQLMLGDVAAARAQFTGGRERYESGATKREFTYWLATSYIYARDAKNAMRELASLLTTNLTPAQAAVLHERMAAVEAYLGDRKTVAGHLTAAATGTPPATHFALKAIVSARIGDLQQARGAVAQFTSMVPASNTFPRTLNALIAIQAKDLATAEQELAAAPQNDLFTKAVRAELFTRKGQKAEAAALRQEISGSSVKLDGNPPVDFFKVMARMHADKL